MARIRFVALLKRLDRGADSIGAGLMGLRFHRRVEPTLV
jgi:hypothetical protein